MNNIKELIYLFNGIDEAHAVIVASIVALIGSILTIVTSIKSSKEAKKIDKKIAETTTYVTKEISNETNKTTKKIAEMTDKMNYKIGELNATTLDKQRIVENIGSQRVIWINNVRQHFVEYNSNVQKLHFNGVQANHFDNIDSEKLVNFSDETLKTIYNIELFLNGEEMYSEEVISLMKKIRKRSLNPTYTIENFEDDMVILIFVQNVILKAEWKRVKEETENGEFLKEERMNEVFDEVGTQINKELHNKLKIKYDKD